MDVNNQTKTEGNIAVELKQFYGSSQTYLKRLERHDEEPLHHILKYRFPKAVQSLYLKMRAPCIILGVKE